MKDFYYTSERNVQIVISLLKSNGIRYVVASPGTTNMTFVASIQHDSFFKIYSSVDERSAAYLACGLALETGEPVVISCTGATASRNYMPGLTEAFYRKLPILAITSHRGEAKIGHLFDQQIDRRNLPNDIAVESVTIPMVKDEEDEAYCILEANKAMLALKEHGGGPVHINMYTKYSSNFTVRELPLVKCIQRYSSTDILPPIIKGRIGIFIGSHPRFTDEETKIIDDFCGAYDAVVFCDHTSNYRGEYEVHFALVCGQKNYISPCRTIDLLIHIGEVSGSLYGHFLNCKTVWRVSEDGALRNTFGVLSCVFEMPEVFFFKYYTTNVGRKKKSYFEECQLEYKKIYKQIPELPFGNIWIAKILSSKLPVGCVLHLGILNSLRSWNFFEIPKTVSANCNVGGFGIDGGLSTLIGASLVNPKKIYLGVLGDLAFFYDINVLGNRHIGNNIRIMLINNGVGTEFRNYDHPCFPLGDIANPYLAAAGHNGSKSTELIKDFARNLGYEYYTASNKKEFYNIYPYFIDSKEHAKPMIFEIFTSSKDESDALEMMLNIVRKSPKDILLEFSKKVVGNRGILLAKKFFQA